MAPTVDDVLASVSPEQRRLLDQYAVLMLKWNQRINVTAAKSVDAVLDHCVDGLVAATLFPANARTLIDIGSGGGLPLIPMAIARPDVAMLGVEPISKKWAFIITAARELGLQNVHANQCRVEDITEQFDIASSKATFEMARWIEIGMRLVVPGGCVLGFGSSTSDANVTSPDDVQAFERAGSSYWIARTWRA